MLALSPSLASLVALLLVPLAVQSMRRGRRRRLGHAKVASECALIIKLGGSAVTDKKAFETLSAAALSHTAAALATSKWASRTVLLHGAGSFGHFQASKFGVSKGTADPRFSWLGFAETRSSVTRLNALVVSALVGERLPACGLPLFPRWTTRRKSQIVRDGVGEVRSLLRSGLLPVLHGDAVLDEEQGCAVLSGDALVVTLCEALRPERAVFLTDVAGVYDRPPERPGAVLLSRIVVDHRTAELRQLYSRSEARGEERLSSGLATSTAAHDVTGGLAAKLEAAAKVAQCGVPVLIVQVGTAHAAAALAGEWPEVGTLIEVGPS